jgi:hypothetical protein
MTESNDNIEREEQPVIHALFPIGADIAIGIQEKLIPDLIESVSTRMDDDYLDTLSGGPINTGSPTFMETLRAEVEGITVERQRTEQAINHQVALVGKIDREVETYFQEPENGPSEARFYKYGAIIMLESLRRTAERIGVSLPILNGNEIERAEDEYLQPEKYPDRIRDRDEIKEDLLNPDSSLRRAFLEGEDTSVEMLVDRINAIRTITLNGYVKRFPKSEPHIYRAISNSGLLKRTRMIESKPTDRYKKALFKGVIDVKLSFLAVERNDFQGETTS